MAHTMEPFGWSLALKTTRHSMIPIILLENNGGTHRAGLCGMEGGRGTLAPAWCRPVGKTFPTGRLFSQPDLEATSMGRSAGGKAEGAGLHTLSISLT